MLTPSYLALYRSGELKRRAEQLQVHLQDCNLCPHSCHVNRVKGEPGFCKAGALPIVASICNHMGEEPPLSGKKGSGTVFFGNCNMRCVYCQNYQISQNTRLMKPKEIDCHSFAMQLLFLQNDLGCHNINFVSPSHFVPQMVQAVLEAVPLGLKIPLVYNTGGYDSEETIKQLDGIIDIYLPDIRYASDEAAQKYSGVSNYVGNNRAAIKEMYGQVGSLVMDKNGIAQRGLIIRHLILPGGLAGSKESLEWLVREISPEVFLSVMAQYYPTHRAGRYPEIARRISRPEYEDVVRILGALELENGWLQDLAEAPGHYLPDFGRPGHPFTPTPPPGSNH